MKNHYKTLGISYKASLNEIKKAYRIMAMKYHPDRNIADKSMHSIFLNVSEAYEILSDNNKRRKYDIQLQAYLKINFSYEENTNSYSNNDNGKGNDNFAIEELLKKIEHQKRIVNSILNEKEILNRELKLKEAELRDIAARYGVKINQLQKENTRLSERLKESLSKESATVGGWKHVPTHKMPPNKGYWIIWPNPCGDYFMIYAPTEYKGDAEYSLLDMEGRELLKGSIIGRQEKVIISGLTKGMHMTMHMMLHIVQNGQELKVVKIVNGL